MNIKLLCAASMLFLSGMIWCGKREDHYLKEISLYHDPLFSVGQTDDREDIRKIVISCFHGADNRPDSILDRFIWGDEVSDSVDYRQLFRQFVENLWIKEVMINGLLCAAIEQHVLWAAEITLHNGAELDRWGVFLFSVADEAGIRWLLSKGLDINKPSKHDGETPLYRAAKQSNHTQVARLLAAGAGASMAIRCFQGCTPLEIAGRWGFDSPARAATIKLLKTVDVPKITKTVAAAKAPAADEGQVVTLERAARQRR